MQRFILAGCHSLVHLNTSSDAEEGGGGDTSGARIVGDPLDIAALQYSGWKYNVTQDCYDWKGVFDENTTDDENPIRSDLLPMPIRLWQIKTFPFDSNRRMSSAIVLAEFESVGQIKRGNPDERQLRVWHLTKGSPDTLLPLFGYHESSGENLTAYNKQLRQLESSGYRTIGLGAKDLTNSTDLMQEIFPDGISSSTKAVTRARVVGAGLHRKDFEETPITKIPNEKLGFDVDRKVKAISELECFGFACFDAAIRASSRRILGELRRGGIRATMLTGDAIDAALAVAASVGLIQGKSVAILEVDDHGLVWKVVKRAREKGGIMSSDCKVKPVTLLTVKAILRRQRQGSCSIAATGRAVELILDSGAMANGKHVSRKVKRWLAQNLFCVSVIARATPVLKKSVISSLKRDCGKQVLMCGTYCVLRNVQNDYSMRACLQISPLSFCRRWCK
jgi:magnesium-transporting ATPase (P-type)